MERGGYCTVLYMKQIMYMKLKTLSLTYVTWFHCSMFRTNIFTFCWWFEKPCLLAPHHRLPWQTLICVYLHIFKNGNLFFNFVILLTLGRSFPKLKSFAFITIDIIIFFVKYVYCVITKTKTLQMNPSVNPSSPIT